MKPCRHVKLYCIIHSIIIAQFFTTWRIISLQIQLFNGLIMVTNCSQECIFSFCSKNFKTSRYYPTWIFSLFYCNDIDQHSSEIRSNQFKFLFPSAFVHQKELSFPWQKYILRGQLNPEFSSRNFFHVILIF